MYNPHKFATGSMRIAYLMFTIASTILAEHCSFYILLAARLANPGCMLQCQICTTFWTKFRFLILNLVPAFRATTILYFNDFSFSYKESSCMLPLLYKSCTNIVYYAIRVTYSKSQVARMSILGSYLIFV